ncbi:vitamin B12 dependent methionine synthase, activation domain [Peptoniphilus sp. oral taxon 375 str. F0436]|nr:vitamin B12 dependent methionine synthase, activation domain [Peptoniphilus sp. oral taxon 375 str. F0436]
MDRVDFFGPSKTLMDLQEDSQYLIFIGATLGKEADVLLQRTNLEDTSLAFVLDGALSAYLEDSLDRIQREDQEKTNLYITDRFSPGYGDIPHDMQRNFADLLEIYKRLGVGLTKENIIIPRKTVLAVYGASPIKPSYRNGCSFCSRQTCREKGKARCSVFDK